MLQLDAGGGEALDALLQKFQGEMRIIAGQGLTHGLDEDGVVGGDAEAAGLQQVALDLEVKGGGERTEEVVCGGAQVGVAAAQVEEGHV